MSFKNEIFFSLLRSRKFFLQRQSNRTRIGNEEREREEKQDSRNQNQNDDDDDDSL